MWSLSNAWIKSFLKARGGKYAMPITVNFYFVVGIVLHCINGYMYRAALVYKCLVSSLQEVMREQMRSFMFLMRIFDSWELFFTGWLFGLTSFRDENIFYLSSFSSFGESQNFIHHRALRTPYKPTSPLLYILKLKVLMQNLSLPWIRISSN